jgi:chemotaxis protein MotB
MRAPTANKERPMTKLILTMLALGVAAGACATTNDGSQRIAALENDLRNKDKEIAGLKAEDASLRSAEGKVDDLNRANQALSQELMDQIKKGNITIARLRDRLTVSVLQEVLFDSGKAEIDADGKEVLDRVANVLKELDHRLIMIEGHTDDVPIGANLVERYPNNWELSTARATTILRYLEDKGVSSKHLGAAGFSAYRPVVPNDSDSNRQRNRRIDIVLTPELSRDRAG